MATDKVKLRKLIDFVAEIAKEKNNEWFVRELVVKLSGDDAHQITGEAINEIHEHCIQNAIIKQAEGFYSSIKYKSIKIQLIGDFIQMEKFRREDNFEGFCFALNQQIECITNAIATKDYLNNISNKLSAPAFKYRNETHSLGEQISNSHNEHKGPIEWKHLPKVKVIIYYHFFKYEIENNKLIYLFDFIEKSKIASDIYKIRNLNHRDSNEKEATKNFDPQEEKRKIQELISNKYNNYAIFMNFLREFKQNTVSALQ